MAYRIIDEHGQIIAVIGFEQQDPILTRGALLTFDDGDVALLEVQRSLLPLLSRTAIAGAVGIALATVLLLIFWLLPTRIINGVFDRLARSEDGFDAGSRSRGIRKPAQIRIPGRHEVTNCARPSTPSSASPR